MRASPTVYGLRKGVDPVDAEGTTLTALLADGLRLRLGHATTAPRRRRRLPVSRVGGGLHPWIDPAGADQQDALDRLG